MNYADITIGQFQKLSHSDFFTLEGQIEAIAILTHKSIEEVEAIPIQDFKKYLKGLDTLHSLTYDDRFIPDFIAGGVKFKVQRSIEKMTGGEYIDLTTFTKSPDNIGLKNDAIISNLHKILALFCKPVARWYQFYKPDINVEEHLQKYMKIETAYPLAVFFCNLLENLMPYLSDYLRSRLKEMNLLLSEKNHLQATGVGS